MVAAKRYSKNVLVRGAVLATVAAVFVAMVGLPAQAQVLYYNTYPSYYAPAPVYQTNCSSVNVLIFSYTNCPNPPAYVYNTSPTYYPSYWNTYYPYYQTNPYPYYNTRNYYYYGP